MHDTVFRIIPNKFCRWYVELLCKTVCAVVHKRNMSQRIGRQHIVCEGEIVLSVKVRYRKDNRMNEAVDEKPMMQNLEDFLTRAVTAEVGGDLIEAERLFRLALYCDAKLHDIADCQAYILQVGPVYPADVSRV